MLKKNGIRFSKYINFFLELSLNLQYVNNKFLVR